MTLPDLQHQEVHADLAREFGIEPTAIQALDSQNPQPTKVDSRPDDISTQEQRRQLLAANTHHLVGGNKPSNPIYKHQLYVKPVDPVEEVDLGTIRPESIFESNETGIFVQFISYELVNDRPKVKFRQYFEPGPQNPDRFGYYDPGKFMDRYVFKPQPKTRRLVP